MSLYLFTRYVDMINLMTYDFHGGSFDSKTGHNSPLKGHPQETGSDAYFNVVRIFRQYNKKSKTFISSSPEPNVSYSVLWLSLASVVGVAMFEDNKKNAKIQWHLKKSSPVPLYQKTNVTNKSLYNLDIDSADKQSEIRNNLIFLLQQSPNHGTVFHNSCLEFFPSFGGMSCLK